METRYKTQVETRTRKPPYKKPQAVKEPGRRGVLYSAKLYGLYRMVSTDI